MSKINYKFTKEEVTFTPVVLEIRFESMEDCVVLWNYLKMGQEKLPPGLRSAQTDGMIEHLKQIIDKS